MTGDCSTGDTGTVAAAEDEPPWLDAVLATATAAADDEEEEEEEVDWDVEDREGFSGTDSEEGEE